MPLVQKKLIGIEIGAERIKIIKGRKGTVTRAASAPLPEGVIRQSKVESKQLLSSAIKKLKKKARVGGGECVLCLNGAETIIRHVYLPRDEPAAGLSERRK